MRIHRHLLAAVALSGLAAATLAAQPSLRVADVGSRGESANYDIGRQLSARSRADVHAEAVAAVAAGQPSYGEIDRTLSQPFTSLKTRAQVHAEAVEAQRLGLISQGEYGKREATAAQLELVRQAGLRARGADLRIASN